MGRQGTNVLEQIAARIDRRRAVRMAAASLAGQMARGTPSGSRMHVLNTKCFGETHICTTASGDFDCRQGDSSYQCFLFDCTRDLYECGPDVLEFSCAYRFHCHNAHNCEAVRDHFCDATFECENTAKDSSFTCVAKCTVPDAHGCPAPDTYSLDDAPGDFICISPDKTRTGSFECQEHFSCSAADDFDCQQSGDFDCGETFSCVGVGDEFTCVYDFTCQGEFDCKDYTDAFDCQRQFSCMKQTGKHECNTYECPAKYENPAG